MTPQPHHDPHKPTPLSKYKGGPQIGIGTFEVERGGTPNVPVAWCYRPSPQVLNGAAGYEIFVLRSSFDQPGPNSVGLGYRFRFQASQDPDTTTLEDFKAWILTRPGSANARWIRLHDGDGVGTAQPADPDGILLPSHVRIRHASVETDPVVGEAWHPILPGAWEKWWFRGTYLMPGAAHQDVTLWFWGDPPPATEPNVVGVVRLHHVNKETP